jgi:hypothetical protein
MPRDPSRDSTAYYNPVTVSTYCVSGVHKNGLVGPTNPAIVAGLRLVLGRTEVVDNRKMCREGIFWLASALLKICRESLLGKSEALQKSQFHTPVRVSGKGRGTKPLSR